MATTTHTPTGARSERVVHTGGGFGGAVAAEWTKLWGLRSSWACLGLTLLLSAVVTALGVYSFASNGPVGTMPANELIPTVILLPQFAVVALASLVITGEYATGAMRTTLTTVPVRGRILAAKALVIALVTFVTGALTGLTSIAVTAAFIGSHLDLAAPGVAHAVLGTGVFFAAIGLFVLGLGAVLRSTAGVVTATIGLLIGVPMVAAILGNEFFTTISNYTPSAASRQLIGVPGGDLYDWPAAIAVLAAWAVAGLAAGYTLLRGRDA